MKQKILLACAASAALFAGTLTASADTDVTSTYLTNAGFDTEADYVKTGICTYAKDVAGNSADGSGLHAVTGWGGVDADSDTKAGGCFQFGGSAWLTGTSYVTPSDGSDGTATGGALGLGACWGGSACYTQDLKANLPAGDYTIEICAYNANTTTTAFGTQTMGIKESNGTTHYVNATWASGQWTKATVTFSITEETAATFYLGAETVAGGSAASAKLFIDYVKIKKADELDLSALTSEISTAQTLLATYQSGTDWYTSLNSAIATAEAAKTSAKNADEVNAAVTALKTAETAAATAYKKSLYATLTDGEYLIQNVKTGKYLGGANSWGTQASLLDHASRFYITQVEDGAYTLDSHTYEKAKHFLNNGYVDGASAEIEIYTTDGGVYLVQDGKYYSAPASGTVVSQDAEASDASVWSIVSLDDAIANLSKATVKNPIDATFLIKGASVSRNLYNPSYEPAWTVDEGNTNKNLGGGNNENQCAESWHSIFNIHQSITGVPNGIYTLTAQAFYRQDGTDETNLPSLYINQSEEAFPLLTGSEDSMSKASTSFSAGNYTMDPILAIVEDGQITVGVKNDNTSLWCIWDNFVLSYMGTISNCIVNADLTTTDAWDATGTKGISGGMAKAGSSATYDFKQTIQLPAGQYKLTAQAAYRYSGSEADEYAAIAAGTMTHYAKMYALVNTDSTIVDVKNRWQGATDAALDGTSPKSVNGKYVPNSSADVQTYMKAGQYDNEVIFNVVETGTDVVIGIKKSASPSVGDYTNIGTWKIERLGDPDPTATIKSNMAIAQALKEEKMGKTEADALTTALNNANTALEALSGIDDANTALKAAITSAQTSVDAFTKAGDALEAMKQLTESTNVYTADALKTYYTDPKASFDAGTMTTEECMALQNPYTITGWHAAITCDNFLLSAWDTNPDFNDAPYYINTWSSEGTGDDSNFLVPFFEYWTNDDKSLEEKTLTATMNDVEPGAYKATATVRVRLNNNSTTAQATGITFQVNDGTAVDACLGSQVKDSQFRLMNVEATGTVASDGVLKIMFNVANSDNNNISWLAFQNVKYEKDTASGISELASSVSKSASKFVSNGQVVILKNGKKYSAAGALLK